MVEVTQKQIAWESIVCLVVDDDKFSRTFVKTALYQIGIKNVKEVGSADEAREIISAAKIDVILLDHQMPNTSGLDFVRELKNNPISGKNIPIIMLTAKGEEEDKIKGLSAGADDYVTKPFSVPELMARVKSQLRRAPEPQMEKELTFEDIRMDLVEKKVFQYIHKTMR